MPTIRKLSLEETQTIENKGKTKRQLVEEQYDAMLADFAGGEYGEVAPEEGESKALVRRRIKEAAQRRDITLTFLRTAGDVLRFKVQGNGHDQERIRVLPPYGGRSVAALEDVEDIPF